VPPAPRTRIVAAPTLQFLGAAGTVTGSRFLVETAGARVLVDCGLFQGLKELRLRNWAPLPVDARSLVAVVLTHAHVDHCGYLPALEAQGFAGAVYATAGTAALCRIVLPDSARLQEEDAAYANRMGYSKHDPALPLYTEENARAALARLREVRMGEATEVAPGVRATFRPAGHILGSAHVLLELAGPGSRRVLVSGDLGRPAHALLAPPARRPAADAILVESTYGDREHAEVDSTVERLAETVVRTAGRGGVVVIPAFAVDRTELVLFHLRALREAGRIPALPVYVDSPMALAALDVYRRALEEGDPEIRSELRGKPGLLDPGGLVEARDVAASKAIHGEKGPAIIVSASGMGTGGRVLHHLERRLPDARSSIALVGFQPAQTRGRRLLDGERAVKLHGRYVPVRAEIVDLSGFSVHADRSEILAWLGEGEGVPDAAFVVHGEPEASRALADGIERELGWNAVVPGDLERVRI
jgi:metallo-beta-lactamase family protein